MVSGRTQDGEQLTTIRRLPPNKSQSSTSIPNYYSSYYSSGESRQLPTIQQQQHPRPSGYGHYQRTLSSSSLLSNKSSINRNHYVDQEPIVVRVPITAPKATATTLSRATSPTPPQYLSSPKKAKGNIQSTEREQDETTKGTKSKPFDPTSVVLPTSERNEETKILIEPSTVSVPSHLVKYCRNAPLKKNKHPLEENIFSSLFITLVAVGVAIVIGIPILGVSAGCLVVSQIVRYSLFILDGIYSYLRFICSNHRHRNILNPPTIFPRDRLAFANDVRWLGKRGRGHCQSILQTLLVFDGSMDLGSLRHLVQTRVILAETLEGDLAYPRLLQKLIPLSAGYRWEHDAKFDIGNHIFPGPLYVRNESQIQNYLASLLQERLPLGKPLWEIRVITNYGAQKDTLAILRVHQCLADGMTLVRILSHSLADQAQMHIPQRPHFAGLSFGFNIIRSFIVGPLTFLMWVFTTFRDTNLLSIPLSKKNQNVKIDSKDLPPVPGNSSCSNTGSSTSNGTSSPKFAVKSKKQGKVKNKRKKKRKKKNTISSWNVVWSAPVSIPKVGRVKQIMRSSLNDVLLAAVAGSVRTYLQKQGIPCPGDVQVVVPIDLRNDISSPKSSTKLGCKVASVLATIPSGMEGAIPRLWATRHRLDELKASADPVVAYGATTILMNILPHALGIAMLDSITDKASLQFSNMPGPSHTLMVGGYPLKGIYPIYPPSGRIRVAISVFTYADQVHLTVVTHKSLTHAGPSLLYGMTTQVDQLSKQLSQRRVPGESRRSARNVSVTNPEITKPATRQIHKQLQVVQEELAELTHKLETPETEEPGISEESLGLRTRLKSLKSEFSELIGELRRRTSIVEGIQMSFEDEECEDDFRKPIRKRALSVVSMGRRNSLFRSTASEMSSSVSYSSDDDDMPSSPQHSHSHHHPEVSRYHQQPSTSSRIPRSPMKTTAV